MSVYLTAIASLIRQRSAIVLIFMLSATTFAQPTSGAQSWQLQTVENAGNVGMYSSLALDSQGNPVISYYADSNLNLLHCGDPLCSSGNLITTVDSNGDVGLYPALVLDSSGHPVISYLDLTNFSLKLARCGDVNCSSDNSLQTVDDSGFVGFHTSLVLDANGYGVISYTRFSSNQLLLAHCLDANCTSSTLQVIDAAGGVGQFTTLALDRDGLPVIGYRDVNSPNLKLARCGTADCSSANRIVTVDSSGDVSNQIDLVLDAADKPIMSYFDNGAGSLRLVYCGNPTCSRDNVKRTVDNGGLVVESTALVLDQRGFPLISYFEGSTATLKVAYCGNVTCSDGNLIQDVEQNSDLGFYTALALDSGDRPVISYQDSSNSTLKVARVQGTAAIESCFEYTVEQSGNSYTAPGWNGNIIVGTNGDDTLRGTKYADLILGLGGNDTISGRGDADVICGGAGADKITSAGANDQLDGGTENDRLNSGSGFHDVVIGGPGDDKLSDPDGVLIMQGGPGADKLSVIVNKQWRNPANQRHFDGLAAGYDNDRVNLFISGRTPLIVDITGDERDGQPSPLEGINDLLKLKGPVDPASTVIKFEEQQLSGASAGEHDEAAEDAAMIALWLANDEWVSAEPEESEEGAQQVIFLPLVYR